MVCKIYFRSLTFITFRRTHSGSLGLSGNLDHNGPVTSNPSAPSVSGGKSGSESTSGHPNGSAILQADHVLLSKSNSCATTTNTSNSGQCFLYDIQPRKFAYIRLLNKPYENQVTLRRQNLPLKCC